MACLCEDIALLWLRAALLLTQPVASIDSILARPSPRVLTCGVCRHCLHNGRQFLSIWRASWCLIASWLVRHLLCNRTVSTDQTAEITRTCLAKDAVNRQTCQLLQLITKQRRAATMLWSSARSPDMEKQATWQYTRVDDPRFAKRPSCFAQIRSAEDKQTRLRDESKCALHSLKREETLLSRPRL